MKIAKFRRPDTPKQVPTPYHLFKIRSGTCFILHIFKTELYCSIFSFAILFLYYFLTVSHTYLQGSFLTAGGSGSDGCPSIGLQSYYALGRNSRNLGI